MKHTKYTKLISQDDISINLDKLTFSLYTEKSLEQLQELFTLNNYILTNTEEKRENNYIFQYDIIFQNVRIATFYIFYKSKYKNLCRIKLLNHSLYTHKSKTENLFNFLKNNFPHNFHISGMDVAIDTNHDILSRFDYLDENEYLKFENSFIASYYGISNKNNKYVRNKKLETKYMLNLNSSFNNNNQFVKGGSLIRSRIENKYNLLLNNRNRQYLIDFLSQNSIDVSKDFYRFEIVMSNVACFTITHNHYIYIDGTINHIITEKEYKNLYPFEKANYTKTRTSKYHDFNIHNLLYDKNYLLNIFYKFNKQIIKNANQIINISYIPITFDERVFITIKKDEVKIIEPEIVVNNNDNTTVSDMFDNLKNPSCEVIENFEDFGLEIDDTKTDLIIQDDITDEDFTDDFLPWFLPEYY